MTKDQYIEQAKRLLASRPPYDQAFVAQAIYTIKQSVNVIEEMGRAVKRSKRRSVVNGDYRPIDVDRNFRMVDDYVAGMKIREIAKKYDLSEGRVSHIILRMGGRKHARSRAKRISERRYSNGQGSAEIG